ncbi:MAG: FAD-binding protein [Chloroflexota bacterium]|nr:FAD-binding protein [Chloroflexota bacterium]
MRLGREKHKTMPTRHKGAVARASNSAIRECDVLVVGGGGAALRAAIAAYERDPDLKITLVTKGKLGQSGVTATACSDRMAFHATLPTTEPGGDDAWRYHAEDIYRIGGYVSDADLAAVLARNAGQAFNYLDELGVPWVRRPDGTVDQFVTDGSAYARACYTGPYTANHIEEALVQRLRELPIVVRQDEMVAELLVDETRGAVAGAVLVSERDEAITTMVSKAIILATGGAGNIFAVNVYPPDCTGDGCALAYRAGAELVNLEFIQIGLCSLKTKLACSGSMMRAIPRLVNDEGEEFLPRYISQAEGRTGTGNPYEILFAKGASWPVSYREPSHIVDIAVTMERAAGRRVFLDYTENPAGLDVPALSPEVRSWYRDRGLTAGDPGMNSPLARLMAINRPSVTWLAERGIDLQAGDMVEVAPAIQHFQGGVKIRTHAETTVKGLFAAGEVAGGHHGANRPGGNALLSGQVLGRLAGENAATYARTRRVREKGLAKPHEVLEDFFSPQGVDAATARRAVRAAMYEAAAVYRTTSGLEDLCRKLDALAQRGISRGDAPLTMALETVNVLQTARLVARAALERDESRGPHLRFPGNGSMKPLPRDDARWCKYIVMQKDDEIPRLERCEPIDEMP